MIISDPTTLISGGDSGTTFASPIVLVAGSTKTITITPGSGILPDVADGVTGQALYSALKILWKNNSTYIKYPFPMEAITPEQFEFINGWKPGNDTTRKALRTCGWVERSAAGLIERLYSGIISLGSLGGTDQPYYQQQINGPSTNFTFQGPVNEAISNKTIAYVPAADVNISGNTLSYTGHGFVNGDRVQLTTSGGAPGGLTANNFYYIVGVSGATFQLETNIGSGAIDISSQGTGTHTITKDYTSFCQVFAREYQKTYASSALTNIGVSTMTYIVYRFPLANSSDSIKITNNDGTVSSSEPYTKINVTWLRDSTNSYAIYNIRGDWTDATSYAISDVVKGSDNRWYKCTTAHTSGASTAPITGGSYATRWASYEGERQLGSNYYPYNIIIDADTDVGSSVSGDADAEEIYEKIQYLLRQNSDIDSNANGSVIGKTASSLLSFVGDTLVTASGVFIESINANDTNRITFTDGTGVGRTYPFVAAGTITFNSNLQSDSSAVYRMYFTTNPSGDYGTDNAVLVDDNTGTDIAGNISGQSSISFTFAYDSNVQGGRTAGTNAPVTVVAVGLATGQFVSTTATITRTTGQNISLVASLERNYLNP